ncbi:(4S)-4-hydroxy-5-phosphonooxypentane-2,3-dione isomerase [Photobacterium nomapromontoriensis]|uniref:(4S)-4-hydroxy-5-phosphonooxypentane-2,3-dione isomerase n=1 Tax=Photobacterium nomapromontoriensis TaxID=2910237 RepID=UPI003D0D4692
MHVTLVEINIKPDKINEFIAAFRPNQQGSIAEEGNIRFDVLQDPEIPTRFTIYEAYRDEAAMLEHKTTPHYLQCVKDLEGLMTGNRSKTVLTGIMWD